MAAADTPGVDLDSGAPHLLLSVGTGAGKSHPPAGSGGVEELADVVDPLDCVDCVALGDACAFHRGFAEGWDACAEFIARHVERQAVEAVAWLPPAADDVDELDRLAEAGGWVR